MEYDIQLWLLAWHLIIINCRATESFQLRHWASPNQLTSYPTWLSLTVICPNSALLDSRSPKSTKACPVKQKQKKYILKSCVHKSKMLTLWLRYIFGPLRFKSKQSSKRKSCLEVLQHWQLFYKLWQLTATFISHISWIGTELT